MPPSIFTLLTTWAANKHVILNLPAVTILFIHDFWSILGHITYFALGLFILRASIQSIKLIPVAIGTTKQLATDWTPVQKTVKVCLIFMFERYKKGKYWLLLLTGNAKILLLRQLDNKTNPIYKSSDWQMDRNC